MIRFRRISQLWNWLPAFRGVAEHESVHGAADALGVSPSALSRSVKLLEDAVGAKLFVRSGNRIALSPAGSKLLETTRNAMRSIDDCLVDIERTTATMTTIAIGVESSVTACIMAVALSRFHEQNPTGAQFMVRRVEHESANAALHRGDADLVIGTDATDHDLAIEALGTASLGVFVGTKHALAARAGSLALPDLQSEAFIVGEGDDGWPTDVERRVVVAGASLEALLTFVNRGAALCVLPDAFANATESGLLRLCDAGTSKPLLAMRRQPLAGQSTPILDNIVESLIAALRP